MIVRPGSTLELLLPILGSFVGISTILVVYVLTWKAGHLPSRTVTPPISFLGCNPPEHFAYQVGFSLTGVVLLGAIEQWRHAFHSELTTSGGASSWTVMAMVWGGYLAAIGVIGQGLVTLEEDILVHLKMGLGISRQSIMHQQLAGIFFAGAALHCYSTAYYIIVSKWWTTLKTTPQERQSADNSKGIRRHPDPNPATAPSSTIPLSSCCYGIWSVRLKLLCVATSLLCWPIAEALHPARTANLDNKRNFNIAGMAQYIAVASYILFFGSYTLDFASLRIKNMRQQQKGQTDRASFKQS